MTAKPTLGPIQKKALKEFGVKLYKIVKEEEPDYDLEKIEKIIFEVAKEFFEFKDIELVCEDPDCQGELELSNDTNFPKSTRRFKKVVPLLCKKCELMHTLKGTTPIILKGERGFKSEWCYLVKGKIFQKSELPLNHPAKQQTGKKEKQL